MKMLRGWSVVVVLSLACQHAPSRPTADAAALGFEVRVQVATPGPLQGRLLVVIAASAEKEPRELVNDDDATAQVFGVDAHGLSVGSSVRVAGDVLGAPVAKLSGLPTGDYWVQAVLNRYETFARADGKTLELPPDQGEGQSWFEKPGNLLSTPKRMHLEVGVTGTVVLELNHLVPPLPPRMDTAFVKHIRIRSEKLSAFWGRPVELGAIVLLPEGFESHPASHYPLVLNHNHFTRTLSGWRETPAEPSLPPPDLAALARDCPNGHGTLCAKHGYKRIEQENGYAFYQQWRGANFPRVLLVQLEHANPFYDDSYAVNSVNVGPYGDALVEELLPYIEKRFRGLGPWARGMYGGSTGGWESLADQVLYPDAFNGAVASCPDPVDFHAYESVNLYADRNAYFSEGFFRRTPRPASRTGLGYTASTVEQENQKELVLGTRSRSGGQYDIWEAVFSPVGDDGYPRRVYDKQTGRVDPVTVAYWREHFDLTHLLERDWATLGPKLQGKLHVNVGRVDTYFLEGAVYRLERSLRAAKNPTSDAHFAYGLTDGHCWTGDAQHPNFLSRLQTHARTIPILVKHFLESAPPGADTTSWRY